jgi:hypothetical protein
MAGAFFLNPLLHVVVRKISRVTLNCTLGVETLGIIFRNLLELAQHSRCFR